MVTAVIVTYNRLAELKTTLAITLKQPFKRVLVLDNACTDGTSAWLATLVDNRLTVIRSSYNAGGAGGFKAALRWIGSHPLSQVEWLVLFDDDAQPEAHYFTALTKHIESDSSDMFVSAVFDVSGSPVEMNRPLHRVPRSLFDQFYFLKQRNHYVVSDYTSKTEVEAASFVGLAIRASVAVDNLDLLKEEFFIYFDDVFFTWGLSQRGYIGQFLPDLRFVHRVNVRRGQSIHPAWKAYFYARNMLPLYRAYSPRWFWVPVILRIGNLALIAIRQNSARWDIIRYSAKGLWHGLLGQYSYNPLVHDK